MEGKEVKVLLPENARELTIEQYQKFLKIQENNDDPYFLQCKMIEIFCHLDAVSVRLLKLSSANRVIDI